MCRAILADEHKCMLPAIQREVEWLAKRMYVSAAQQITGTELAMAVQCLRKFDHLLRDCLVDISEEVSKRFVFLELSNDRKGNGPRDSAISYEIDPRREAGGVTRRSYAETEFPCKGRCTSCVVVVKESTGMCAILPCPLGARQAKPDRFREVMGIHVEPVVVLRILDGQVIRRRESCGVQCGDSHGFGVTC